jgi:hypothetical protein
MTARSIDRDHASAGAQAIAEALGRLGEPITGAQARAFAAEQDCDCQEGMFALAPTRRGLLSGAGLVAAVGTTSMLPRTTLAKAPPGAVEYQVPDDPTKKPGRLMGADGGYGSRSQFETDVRWVNKSDPHCLLHTTAVELRHDHAVGPTLRTTPRRHPEYRPCQAPPHYSRHGRPADQVFARRSQAVPDSLTHLHYRNSHSEASSPIPNTAHGTILAPAPH